MNKIISFSSFTQKDLIHERISLIKKELSNEKLSCKKLGDIEEEIQDLSINICHSLQATSPISNNILETFEENQLELSTLKFKCHSLFLDKKVDQITLKAQKLAYEFKQNKSTTKKICGLKKSITSLHLDEALSLENRQMINLAKKFIKALESEKKIISICSSTKELREQAKKISCELIDYSEISMDLYDLAGFLYEKNFKEAMFCYYSLPEESQKRLQTLLSQENISIEESFSAEKVILSKEKLTETLQVIIGYAHELIEGSFQKPTKSEIHLFLKDLKELSSDKKIANF